MAARLQRLQWTSVVFCIGRTMFWRFSENTKSWLKTSFYHVFNMVSSGLRKFSGILNRAIIYCEWWISTWLFMADWLSHVFIVLLLLQNHLREWQMLCYLLPRYYMAVELFMCKPYILEGALFKFKFWCVNQNLISYMWQMIFANVSIQEWIINPLWK